MKMKTNKLTKIFVLTLSLALLIGTAIGISVSANTDGKVEFYAQTIIHNDKIAIAYAPQIDVTDDLTAADELKVEYKIGDSGEWKSAVKRAETYVVKDGSDEIIATYPIYATEGMPAQDFTETVYAVAYTGDTRPETAETYSVMQFLYTKLYKDNYIKNTNSDTEGYAYKELYLSLISYAEKAQIALDKWKSGEDVTGKLITDHHMIIVDGGTIDDTGLSSVISTQETVTLKYSGELADGSVCTWSVTSYDHAGNVTVSEVANDSEVPVTGNMLCSPNVEAPAASYVKGSGYYYSDADIAGKKIDFEGEGDTAITYTTSGANPVGELLGDTDKYTYADFSSISKRLNATLTFNTPTADDKSFILEFDAKFDDANGTLGYIMLADKINGGSSAGARSSVYLTGEDGKIIIHKSNHEILAGENISVKQGEWHNFRFEYNYVSNASQILVKVYIDNVWQCDIYTNGTATESSSNYRSLIYVNTGLSTKISLDNIYLGYSTEAVTVTTEEN